MAPVLPFTFTASEPLVGSERRNVGGSVDGVQVGAGFVVPMAVPVPTLVVGNVVGLQKLFSVTVVVVICCNGQLHTAVAVVVRMVSNVQLHLRGTVVDAMLSREWLQRDSTVAVDASVFDHWLWSY